MNGLRTCSSSGRGKVVIGSGSVNNVQHLEHNVLGSRHALGMAENNTKLRWLGWVIDAVGNVRLVVGVEAKLGIG